MHAMTAHLLLLAAVILWGWTFVFTRILVAELDAIEVFALRLAIGVPFLAGVLLLRRVPLAFTQADLRPLLVGSLIFSAHFLVQIVGLETTTATNTGWLISVSPLVLAGLSYALLGERLGRAGIGGIVLATAGVLLLISRGRLADLAWLRSTGDWLVLGSAFTWAFFTVATRNLVRRRNPLAVTLGVLLIASAITAVLFVAGGDLARIRSLSPAGILAALYLGIPGLALGQWFWHEGVRRLGATRAGVYLYVEPLATMSLAVPLLDEPLTLIVAAGGALVLGGVYLAGHDRRT